jgi:hypothetical protein
MTYNGKLVKPVKQEQKQKDEQEAKVRQTLNRALGQPDPNDIFAYALQGMYASGV